jgi:hypothetical protein
VRCRMSELGAHHAWCLLLQELFITARVLPAPSTTTARTIDNGYFMATSPMRAPDYRFRIIVFQMNPT